MTRKGMTRKGMTRTARLLSVPALLLAAVVCQAPVAVADPADPGSWPIADGDFSTEGDPGWVFFLPQGFDGRGCGIGPDGTIGCDIVPSRWPDGTSVQAGLPGPPGFYSCGDAYCPLPPADADQVVAGPDQRAEYGHADTMTFTRDVDVLFPGYRVINGEASCGVGYQGSVRCDSGEHGFSVSALGVMFR